MAKRTKEHQVGDRGIKIVLNQIDDDWVDQEQHKDYGVDLKFEIFENERTTGLEFGAQVKSTETLKIVTDKKTQFVSFKIEVENLIDHVEMRRYPVFLFGVDVINEIVYWECLQHYASKYLKNNNWKSQKNKMIRLPMQQTLGDLGNLKQAVITAQSKIMTASHFISPSIELLQNEVSELDPRLMGKTIVSEKGVFTQIVAKEEAQFQLTVSNTPGDNAVRRFGRIIKHGTSEEFNSDQIAISGSPFFESKSFSKIAIWKPELRDSEIVLETIDRNENVKTEWRFPDTVQTGGSEKIIFNASGESIPMNIELRCDMVEGVIEGDFQLNVEKWEGLPLKELKDFSFCKRFVESILNGDDACISIYKKGNFVVRFPRFPKSDLVNLKAVGPTIHCIEKAIKIANHYNINPSFCVEFDQWDVNIFHWLLFDRSQRNIKEFVIEIGFSKFDKSLFKNGSSSYPIASIRQTFDRLDFDFFGEVVSIAPILIEYRAVEIVKREDVLSDELAENEVVGQVITIDDTTALAALTSNVGHKF